MMARSVIGNTRDSDSLIPGSSPGGLAGFPRNTVFVRSSQQSHPLHPGRYHCLPTGAPQVAVVLSVARNDVLRSFRCLVVHFVRIRAQLGEDRYKAARNSTHC